MRKLIVVSLFAFWFSCNLKAQSQPTGNPDYIKNFVQVTTKPASDASQLANTENLDKHLIINSDSRVDTLIQIHREENIRNRGIEGYRFDGYSVQIFKGNWDAANQMRTKFLKIHENIKVYLWFPDPDFAVRVGDFRTKSEAIKMKYFIKNDFPGYIIDGLIYFPELEQYDLEN